jgi:hypothetical protein
MEAKQNIIRLESALQADGQEDYSADHPEAVKFMIDFAYLGQYKVEGDGRLRSRFALLDRSMEIKLGPEHIDLFTANTGPLAMHTRVWALGSKYLIPELKSMAVQKVAHRLAHHDIPASPSDLAAAITIAYSTGSEQEAEMRECIIYRMMPSLQKLMAIPDIRDAVHESEGAYSTIIEALTAKNTELQNDLIEITTTIAKNERIETVPFYGQNRYRQWSHYAD